MAGTRRESVKKGGSLKIWPDAQKQTLAFELPQLPGETFKIVIPELVSDNKEPIIPSSLPSPNWDIEKEAARWQAEIRDVVRMEAAVLFRDEQIQTSVTVTNLSHRIWENVNAFTCFAYYDAPLFDDPKLTRTYLLVEEEWKSIAELFAENSPGNGPYTFFRVRGGPALEDMWNYRRINQIHPQVVSRGCCCVVSTDGQWIAGMTTRKPAYVFNNRNERCIHADPDMGNVAPGETSKGNSTVHIFRGTLGDFVERCEKTV